MFCTTEFIDQKLVYTVKDAKKLSEMGVEYKDINYELKDGAMIFKNYNALDLLSRIFDLKNTSYIKSSYDQQIYNKASNKYITSYIPQCLFFKDSAEAVLPSKKRASDVGYDLTIISKVKDISSKTAMYETDIRVQPPFGYYTKVVPRSSLSKLGYMMTNSIGIIDGTYTGTLKIVLTKIDDSLPDITLPNKCCQLILDKAIHYTAKEITDLSEMDVTDRASGGFGSTS